MPKTPTSDAEQVLLKRAVAKFNEVMTANAIKQVLVSQRMRFKGFENWHQMTVSKLLAGERPTTTFDEVLGVADILGISPDELLRPEQSVDRMQAVARQAWETFTDEIDTIYWSVIGMGVARTRYFRVADALHRKGVQLEVPEDFAEWVELVDAIPLIMNQHEVTTRRVAIWDAQEERRREEAQPRNAEGRIIYAAEKRRRADEERERFMEVLDEEVVHETDEAPHSIWRK